MLGSVLRFVGSVGAKNFSPLRWVPWVLCVLCILFALVWSRVQHMRLDAARAELSAEQSAHAATSAELAESRREATGLRLALDQARNATEALQDNLRAALAREVQARSDAQTRKKIMQAMRTRERTGAEALEVMDDQTRAVVAARLNRTW